MRFLKTCLAATMLLGAAMAGSVTGAEAAEAVPVKASHYSGTWLEIARRPMWLTDGCVAGFTTYSRGEKPGQVKVLDGCHEGSPDGKLKTINGKGTLNDPANSGKLRVRYPLLITWDYWVLYTAPDRSWFISADPKMKNLWIYAREVPSKKQLARMTAKAAALGYDVSKLEFPEF